ncbi:hypothetical protein PHIN6_03030 [Polynucleobacter sp. HIN6]|uniref:rhamnan synthesis F family protein n=1 Tax=Polynucleobacter sp. HIN6 TaxID=3047865 RepID=UPI0025723CC2|nr:rhamnan synthesis F family protein [Polynucleobacter sp. HIN6]BEI34785.1 hypothetical protein PHIN6_03030 [Polynucleobacter sp. HIN6]
MTVHGTFNVPIDAEFNNISKNEGVNRNKLIVVLGMHRSGTSLITRGLTLLGVDLGDNLYSAAVDNPKGFWEDMECLSINEALLDNFGSAYDKLGIREEKSFDNPIVNNLKNKAKEVLKKRLKTSMGLWGFKDPRTCRLLWFWEKVFKEIDCDVFYLIVIRNPSSVVKSLATRNETPKEKSYLLWFQHVLASIVSTEGYCRVIVDYDLYLKDPLSHLSRIASSLHLKAPNLKTPETQDYLSNFLEKELNHYPDHKVDADAPREVVKLFNYLLDFASDTQAASNQIISDSGLMTYLNVEFLNSAFRYINLLEDININEVMRVNQEWLLAKNQITERDNQIQSLNNELMRVNQEWLLAKNQITERDNQIQSLNNEVMRVNQEWLLAKNQITERDNQIQSLNNEVMRVNQEWLGKSIEIDSIKLSFIWRLTNFVRVIFSRFGNGLLIKNTTQSSLLPHLDYSNDLSKLPIDFDPDIYLAFNPDVALSQIDPIEHFINYGEREGRKYKGFEIFGSTSFSEQKETILIVTHEASRTGAPVLSLNLVREFSKKFNVLSLILDNGVLKDEFLFDEAGIVAVENIKYDRKLASLVITKLTKRFNFKFAIVNSIESRVVLDGLSQNSVPTITLIHEFASYTRPEDAFPAALFWSSEVVFSASIVRENAFLTYPHLSARSTHIIPQGRCLLPIDDLSQIDIEQECIRIRSLMRPKDLDPHTKIILGAGFVQMRKGIDLFVECATRVVGSPGGEKCRFVWIGKGYDPENDIAYSVYIKDQIERAGLQKYIFFIDETPAIEAAYEEADLFLLSSRLDPLPNVAIEVMSYGVPVLCFNKTTGIADFLIESGLEEVCVAQYIDTAEMAQKIISLLNSESLYQATAQQCQQAASQYFDMKTYVAKLEQLGENAKAQMEQDKLDGQTIIESGLLKEGFLNFPSEWAVTGTKNVLLSYINGHKSNLKNVKPHPGFHPGIYREQHGLASPNVDPFADYLRAGRPKGPWSYPVITSQTNRRLPALPQNKRVALHIHAYYPELFASIIDALLSNQIRPDLFVSVPDQQGKEKVMYELRRYQGVKHDIRVVPNRGRDIGPFLTEFGKDFLEGYDFVGHIHTKKSVDIKDAQTGDVWYRFALANLLGIKQHPMADVILTEFNINSTLGIVFPDDPNIVGWDKNKEHAKPIAKRMGIETLPENFLFPVGAMFWARTKALMPFFNLNLDWEDYPAEPLPYDGSTLHAIERLLGFPAKGYQVATSYVQGVMR